MRKLVAVNTIMGMEEIEKLDILQEYQKRLPQYDIVENTDEYFKNKSTTQLRYDRIIILVAAIIAIILCILGIKHIKYTHTYEYKFVNKGYDKDTINYFDNFLIYFCVIIFTISNNIK